MIQFQVTPIGKVHANEEGFSVEVYKEYLPALRAMDGFSHFQFIWWASECDSEEARKYLETPSPYKGSPEVMGIFATRSPIRPNPIAISVAQVFHIDYETGRIQVPYIDANDGTPLLDIKPYTPSMDRVESPQVPTWCQHWPKSIETSGDFDWESQFNF